jgi:hypothetical protein
MVDEKTKELLYNADKGYKYDKEGMKKLIAFTRDLIKEYDAKEVEVIPFITTDVPEGILEEEKELLTGLVL